VTEHDPFDGATTPLKVVAIGGGTGMPGVLRGMRELVDAREPANLTAIVTMADDGGSSGRLRKHRGMLPPGDVRNCLVAMSAEQDLLAGLFQHRYDGGEELDGHNLGNLILTALAEQTGSFMKAVEVSSRVLRTVGRILPVTVDDVRLTATTVCGRQVEGESAINDCSDAIKRVALVPSTVRPAEGVVEAIMEADLVALGPGSLYTSLLPNIAMAEVAKALRETHAVRVLVGNLVQERGESPELGLGGHIDAVNEHAGGSIVDALLVHDGEIPQEIRERYREQGSEPCGLPDEATCSVRLVRRPLLKPRDKKLRHDPNATAEGLLAAWNELHQLRTREDGNATLAGQAAD